MKSAGKARNNGLYRHIRTSKEIIRNLLNDLIKDKQKIQTVILILYARHKIYNSKLNCVLSWRDRYEVL